MILISGSSEREIVDLQQGDYEEMDQLAIAKPLCKAAFRVLHAEDIGVGVARAIRAAVSGRPGGVYLDLPAKLFPQTMDAEAGGSSLIKVVDRRRARSRAGRHPCSALSTAQEREEAAHHPRQGRGVRAGRRRHPALVERTGIPYLPMSMAKGLLPDTHEQSASAARSFVLPGGRRRDADRRAPQLAAVARQGQDVGRCHAKAKGGQKFVQIDISPQEADSNVRIDAPVVGDIGSCVAAMLAAMGNDFPKPPAWTMARRRQGAQDKNVAKMAETLAKEPSPMNFQSALNVVRDIVKANPTRCSSTRAPTRSTSRAHRRHVQSRASASTSARGDHGHRHGLRVAAPWSTGQQVIAVEGDSAFGFSGMEVGDDLPLQPAGVHRDHEQQRRVPRRREEPDGGADPSPLGVRQDARYEKMMEAFGGVGVPWHDAGRAAPAMEEAIRSRRPTLINAVIDEAAAPSGRITSLNPDGESAVTAPRAPNRINFIITRHRMGKTVMGGIGRRPHPGLHARAVGTDLHAAARLVRRRRDQGRARRRGRHHARAAARHPGVDSLYFTMLNHNKALDHRRRQSKPKGKAILERSSRDCDVLVENFAPGALDRMGFTWEHIQQLNPRMIVASVKGFGPGRYGTARSTRTSRSAPAARRRPPASTTARRWSPARRSATAAPGCTGARHRRRAVPAQQDQPRPEGAGGDAGTACSTCAASSCATSSASTACA